jgi:hypothetical protein
MALRNPIITDRGADHPNAKFARFICYSRGDSRTGYPGTTAAEAYEWWAKSTSAGRFHKHRRGFLDSFVRATGSASHG